MRRRPTCDVRRHVRVAAVAVLLIAVNAPRSAPAKSLEDVLISTFPGALRADGEGLAQVFTRSVAASFPITGTSSSYAYRFDPETDAFVRLDIPLGPVFSERARAVGAGKVSLSVAYLYLDYDTINGRDLNNLISNSPNGGGEYIAVCFPPPNPVCEPVLGRARLDLEAQIVTFSATYGVTPDLDLNIYLPVVRTYLRSSTTFVGPDPRAPADPSYRQFSVGESGSDSSIGVGDLLLRAKYIVARTPLADLAAAFNLSLPTGDPANFQGTGDTLVWPALYASQLYLERIEPHLNLGFVIDANHADRSQARYSAGADFRLFDWLTLNTDFLGTSDLTTPGTIDQPVFVQIERSDVFQFSTGLKVAPVPGIVVFFNALLPLNDQGFRADQAFAGGLQWVF